MWMPILARKEKLKKGKKEMKVIKSIRACSIK